MIWTDVIQFALYLTGSVAAFLLLLHKIPGGWSEVTHVAAAAGGKLTIFDFAFSLTKELHILDWDSWRHFSDDGKPWNGSNTCAAVARSAK